MSSWSNVVKWAVLLARTPGVHVEHAVWLRHGTSLLVLVFMLTVILSDMHAQTNTPNCRRVQLGMHRYCFAVDAIRAGTGDHVLGLDLMLPDFRPPGKKDNERFFSGRAFRGQETISIILVSYRSVVTFENLFSNFAASGLSPPSLVPGPFDLQEQIGRPRSSPNKRYFVAERNGRRFEIGCDIDLLGPLAPQCDFSLAVGDIHGSIQMPASQLALWVEIYDRVVQMVLSSRVRED